MERKEYLRNISDTKFCRHLPGIFCVIRLIANARETGLPDSFAACIKSRKQGSSGSSSGPAWAST
jgi:hypothetical protein